MDVLPTPTDEEAVAIARKIGYPVLVRPPSVLGGGAMATVYDASQLEGFVREAVKASPEHPILIERPIVLNDDKAALGRPPEAVLEIL